MPLCIKPISTCALLTLKPLQNCSQHTQNLHYQVQSVLCHLLNIVGKVHNSCSEVLQQSNGFMHMPILAAVLGHVGGLAINTANMYLSSI